MNSTASMVMSQRDRRPGAFQRQRPCPTHGEDHGTVLPDMWCTNVVPLKRGGADKAETMRWQTDTNMKGYAPILKSTGLSCLFLFVSKPVDADYVLAKVRQLLGSPLSPSSR